MAVAGSSRSAAGLRQRCIELFAKDSGAMVLWNHVLQPAVQSTPFGKAGPLPKPRSGLPQSDLGLLSHFQRVVNLDAEIANGAFELGVPEQQLDCAQILGAPVDQ